MIGFFFFIMTVVLGAVGLAWGLRLLGVIPGDRPLSADGVSRHELERMQDALTALDDRLGRLEDQQVFLERLLADRDAPRSLAAPAADPEDGDADERVRSILFETGPEEG